MRLCIYVSINDLENELAIGNTSVMIDCVLIRLDIHWRYAMAGVALAVCSRYTGNSSHSSIEAHTEDFKERIRNYKARTEKRSEAKYGRVALVYSKTDRIDIQHKHRNSPHSS